MEEFINKMNQSSCHILGVSRILNSYLGFRSSFANDFNRSAMSRRFIESMDSVRQLQDIPESTECGKPFTGQKGERRSELRPMVGVIPLSWDTGTLAVNSK